MLDFITIQLLTVNSGGHIKRPPHNECYTLSIPFPLGCALMLRAQMDRASEFVGRCLYVLESACMDGFRPINGASRLDASLEVNRTYLAAMFRHMQVTNSGAIHTTGICV